MIHVLEPTDVGALARDRVDTWGAVAQGSDVALRLDAPGPVGPALAVRGAVEQVLDNLIDNALAVAPAGTTVTISPTRRCASSSASSVHVAGLDGSGRCTLIVASICCSPSTLNPWTCADTSGFAPWTPAQTSQDPSRMLSTTARVIHSVRRPRWVG